MASHTADDASLDESPGYGEENPDTELGSVAISGNSEDLSQKVPPEKVSRQEAPSKRAGKAGSTARKTSDTRPHAGQDRRPGRSSEDSQLEARRKTSAEPPCPPGHHVYEFIQQASNVIYEISAANLGNVCLSNISRDPSIHLSADQLTMFGSQGYRTAKATHGVCSGLHYFECSVQYPTNVDISDILQAAPQFWPQWRIGLAGLDCECDAPLGYDARGFALRSVDGSACYKRRRYLRDQESRWDAEDAEATEIAAEAHTDGPTTSPKARRSDPKTERGPQPPVVCSGPHIQVLHEFTRTSLADGFYFGPQATISCLVYLPTDNWPRLPQEIEYSVSLEAPWESQRVSGRQDTTLPEHRTYKPRPANSQPLSAKQKLEALLSKDLSEIQITDLAYGEYYDYDLNRAPFYRKPVPGSFIALFCDGELSFVARDVPYDIYYPAASSFCYGTVTFDFGPQNIRRPEFPREWAFYPPALDVPDTSHPSLCKHFKYFSQVCDCLTSNPGYFGVTDGNEFLSKNPIVPFSSLYLERAKVEYANFIALIDSGKLTPKIWDDLSAWHAALLKRAKARQR